MRKLLGEPVAAAEAVYRDGGRESSKNRVWRYYYEDEFWTLYTDSLSPRSENI